MTWLVLYVVVPSAVAILMFYPVIWLGRKIGLWD